jgi:hypothetical protein
MEPESLQISLTTELQPRYLYLVEALGWIDHLHRVPAGEHLLAVTSGRSPELVAASPGRDVLWRKPLPHVNAIYSWDLHGFQC